MEHTIKLNASQIETIKNCIYELFDTVDGEKREEFRDILSAIRRSCFGYSEHSDKE